MAQQYTRQSVERFILKALQSLGGRRAIEYSGDFMGNQEGMDIEGRAVQIKIKNMEGDTI